MALKTVYLGTSCFKFIYIISFNICNEIIKKVSNDEMYNYANKKTNSEL